MDIAILLLTAICALGAIIASIPVIATWRRKKDVSVNIEQGTGRWWFVFTLGIIALIFSALGLYRTFENPTVTTSNVEDYIKKWLDEYALSHREPASSEADPNAVFAMQVTFMDGMNAVVERLKQHEKYLVIYTNVFPPQQTLEAFNKLTSQQQLNLKRELLIEAAKMHADVTMRNGVQSFYIEKHVPIANLTEDTFMEGLADTREAQLILLNTLILELDRAKPPAT